ncbi:MAG: 5-deoxy-glucuronate isomerase, partial [Clostridia bacterium]|nr:5-deoxy-glucuronate isomerase [Clostridia bacterium]
MFAYPEFNENGVKTLCEIGKLQPEMNMTIRIKRFKENETLTLKDESCETAFLLLKGEAEISWNCKTEKIKRANPFEKTPYCLHVPKNTDVTITAKEGTEILIEQTENERYFDPVFYTPDDILYQEFGKGQWDGTGYRICSTVFDYDNAPYSNMVLGEVFNQPGRWSSYPPHHHPQPEVYYYQFDKPQGFGACFIGDNVFKSTEGSACFITDGFDHQQVVAPGYEMCYVWMIRHIDGD